jgi:hypothetical protein
MRECPRDLAIGYVPEEGKLSDQRDSEQKETFSDNIRASSNEVLSVLMSIIIF